MKKASFFTQIDDKKCRCDLCPHHCVLQEGHHGLCLTRQNVHGILVAQNYCRPVSTAIDPIEKKPLYHFYPGSEIYSTGPNGCTFKCIFCQNSEISQQLIPVRERSVDALVEAVVASGTIGIAYTYSEPYIWFETIMEVGLKVKEQGLKNVMVTNGSMEPAPLADLLTVVDAMNIDIKSIRPDFYRRLCKAELAPVLRSCETVKKSGHLEITNLVIPGENDSTSDFRELTEYIVTNLGRDTPLHFSRYFPRYQATYPSTPLATLYNAWEIAREKLEYVYVGNIASDEKSNTFCPSCNYLLIERSGYSVGKHYIQNTHNKNDQKNKTCVCPSCGYTTNIVI